MVDNMIQGMNRWPMITDLVTTWAEQLEEHGLEPFECKCNQREMQWFNQFHLVFIVLGKEPELTNHVSKQTKYTQYLVVTFDLVYLTFTKIERVIY